MRTYRIVNGATGRGPKRTTKKVGAAFAVWALIGTLTTLVGFGAGISPAAAEDNISITVDSGGPDDVPAQTDVSLLGFDDGHLPDYFFAQMQFDDTVYPGGNSGDGCIFFDSDDAGGFSDFAVCGSFIQNTTTGAVELQSAALYDCKGSEPSNDEGKRCGFIGGGGDGSNGIIAQDLDGDGTFESDGDGNPLATPYDTTCSLNTTASDPFNGVGVHNTSGEQDPITDTQLSCTIYADELVELNGDVPTGIVVSNACSFTSPDPSSESKDCVVDAGSGFLQIVKNVETGDPDATFDYTLDGSAFASITTVGGTGSTDNLAVDGSATLNLAEVVPDGWQLDSATCDNGDSPDSLTVGAATTVVCTFTNSIAFTPAPEIGIVKGATLNDGGDGQADAGDTISYTFDVTNIGNVDLVSVSVTDPLISDPPNSGSISCPQTTLFTDLDGTAPFVGETIQCTATYTLTQANIDAGQVDNTATANGQDADASPVSAQDSASVPLPAAPALTLVKSTTTTTYDSVGDLIDYSYSVENTGNVTLAGPVTISDDKTTATCADLTTIGDLDGDLDVGETVTCTAVDYAVTQADIDFGSVTNLATASADGTTSNEASVTVDATQTPALTLVKSTTTTTYDSVGDLIDYSYSVENTGNVTLAGPVTISDDKTTATCADLTTIGDLDGDLDVGETVTCTAVDYAVTQADIDFGSVTNLATASADGTTSNEASVTVDATQTPALTLVKSTTTTTYDSVGDLIDYSYSVENTGNVTLAGPVTISDDKTTATCADLTTIGDLDGDLDVGETVTCTAVDYAVTQADIDFGSVTNLATASADGTTSNEASVTVDATQTPALTLVKSTTTTTYDSVGDLIDYSYSVENTGNVTLAGPVTISDDKTTATCADLTTIGDLDGDLDVGETVTCTAVDYAVTQADIDFGSVTNLATASADGTTSNEASVTVDATQTPLLSVVKSLTNHADEDGSDDVSAGDILTYTIIATNAGNITLTNVTVHDSLTDDLTTCASVAPMGTCVLVVTYTVQNSDIGTTIHNVGTADSDQTDPVEEDEDVPVPTPSLETVKVLTSNTDEDGSGDVSAGDTLNYSITVTNTGTANLTDVTVVDDLTGASTACVLVLAAANNGGTAGTCVLDTSYVVTSADVAAGEIVNTGTGDSDQTPPDEDPNNEPVPTPSLETVKVLTSNTDEDGSGDVSAGDTLNYSITVTNTGTANLTDVTVVDDLTGASTACVLVLAAANNGGTAGTCVLDTSYVVTSADVAAGEIVNTGTGDSDQTPPDEDPNNEPVPTPSLETVKVLTSNTDEDGSGDVSAGDTLNYSITVTNTGTANLTDVTVVDDLTGASTACVLVLAAANNGGTAGTCVLDTSYVVTSADVAAGEIVNTGTGDSDQTPPDEDPNNEPVPTPSLETVKVVDSITNPDFTDGGTDVDEDGDVIAYTITVTNNGTANLTNVTVVDDLTGDSTSCALVLAAANNGGVPGTCVLTTTYTATQADVDNNGTNPTLNGFIDNTATGDSVQTDPVSDSEQVPVIQSPAHTLVKDFDPDEVGVGEMGTFTLLYMNTGNVTLSDVDITDVVDPRLVVDTVETTVGSCSDPDNDAQTVLCEVDSLAPGGSVTVTVTYQALAEDLVPDGAGVTSGANYVFYFDNGYVLFGSTDSETATLLDENRDPVPAEEWSVEGRNQDIFFTVPYAGGADGGFELHLSCSEAFIDGWGSTGPIEGEDDPDWEVLAYTVERFNSQGFLKDCTQTFPFDVENTASAEATPAGGTLTPNPIMDSDSVHVVNIAPIEVTRDRLRRGDVEIQYFNTSFEDLEIEIIRVEWTEAGVLLESASYKDGVDLGISGGSPAEASIDTIMPDRGKDWLKLSFDSGDAPAGLTVTIVTSTGATFTHVYGA